MWFLIIGIFSVAVVAWLVNRFWLSPARRLEQLMIEVAEGRQPRTFVLHGARWFQRQSERLEKISELQQDQEKRLSEAVFNLRAVLGCMVESVMVVDADQRIRLANNEFQDLFGAPSNPVGRTVLETVRDSGVANRMGETLRTGAGLSYETTLHHLKQQEGSPQIRINMVPIIEPDGAVTGAVAVIHDISRLKQLEDVRREFVANVSHELRTPLAIFRGYLELLIDNPELPQESRAESLGKMERHCTRLTALIDDLLTITRLESGMVNIKPVRLDVAPLITEVVNDYSKRHGAGKVRFIIDLPEELPDIESDPLRLEQMLLNLLENAVAYSRTEKRIEVSAAVQGQEMVIGVKDHGVGIAASDLPHIFKRFYRVEKGRSRAQGGTGLGLSIVKHIMQRHGGTVTAESEVGKWTFFSLRFPLEAGKVGDASRALTEEQAQEIAMSEPILKTPEKASL